MRLRALRDLFGDRAGRRSLRDGGRLDPGDHVIRVTGQGGAGQTLSITLVDAGWVERSIRITPIAPVAADVAPPTQGSRTPGYVVGGIGIAALVATVAFGALAIDAKNIEEKCPGGVCNDTTLRTTAEPFR